MESDLFFGTRPELKAGGFARDDGTVEFYLRVRSILKKGDFVLDLGAGRGAQLIGGDLNLAQSLRTIKGNVAKIIGADVDPVVLDNPFLDEAVVTVPGQRLPFSDQLFDVVVCDWVLEHVEEPNLFVEEVFRILKPGGWFCARTPNKYSYFALGSRLIPERCQSGILEKLQSARESRDVFPKFYRINSSNDIKRFFTGDMWKLVYYLDNPPPAYSGGNKLLYISFKIYQIVFPSIFLVFSQKKRTGEL